MNAFEKLEFEKKEFDENYKKRKAHLKEVFLKLIDEKNEWNWSHNQQIFRRAFLYYLGEYENNYSFNIIAHKFRLENAQKIQDNKLVNLDTHLNIIREYPNSTITNSMKCGVITTFDNIEHAIDIKSFWIWFLKNSRDYKESLEKFIEDFKASKLLLYGYWSKYNDEEVKIKLLEKWKSDSNEKIEIVNCKKLDIKDILIILNDK
jgi:hypothetical protein